MNTVKVCCLSIVIMGTLLGPLSVNASPLEDKTLHHDAIQRYVMVYTYVDELPAGSVRGRLLETAKARKKKWSPRVLQELQIALLQRLTSINPMQALEFALGSTEETRESFVGTVFDTWATFDLEAAIGQAMQLTSEYEDRALDAIVGTQLHVSLPKLREIAMSLGLNKSRIIESYAETINAESIEDPERAWYELVEFTKEDHPRFDNRALLERFAILWFKRDGFDVIKKIRSMKGNGSSYEAVIKYLAQESPHVAFEYLRGLSGRKHLLEDQVMSIWVKTDPVAALKAVADIQQHDLREDFQRDIANEWGSQEPRYILRNLHVLPAHSRPVAVQASIEEIAKSSLQEAGKLALQIEDSELQTVGVGWLLYYWSEREPSTLLDWLSQDLSRSSVIEEVRVQLVYNILDFDPVRAFQLARELPIADWELDWNERFQLSLLNIPFKTSGLGLEAQIMDDIAGSDVQTALELLPYVREGDTKTVATLQVGYALRYQGEINQALNLAEQLPESDREKYYKGIVDEWILSDPKGLVDAISKFQTKNLRSIVALQLLRWNRRHDELSDNQVKNLQPYLTDAARFDLEYY